MNHSTGSSDTPDHSTGSARRRHVCSAAAAAVISMALVACGSDTGPAQSPPSTESRAGSIEIVETITIADYYGACGNETLVEPDATWYPLVTMRDLGGETFDASAYEPIPDPVAPQGLVRVADPGPGDDSGTLYVYADGIGRFVSDSGTIRRWMTTVEQQYEFAC